VVTACAPMGGGVGVVRGGQGPVRVVRDAIMSRGKVKQPLLLHAIVQHRHVVPTGV